MYGIYTDENILVDTHVCCRLCESVLKHSLSIEPGRRGYTSNLLKHLRICTARALTNKKNGEYIELHATEYSGIQYFSY